MTVTPIYYIVTIAGALFVAGSLGIIFLGKSVGEPGGKQIIEVGDRLKLSLNSALTLVLLSGAIMLSPLLLIHTHGNLDGYVPKTTVESDYYTKKFVKKNYIHRDKFENGYTSNAELNDRYLLRHGNVLQVHGIVIDNKGDLVEGAKVRVIVGTQPRIEDTQMTDDEGGYSIKFENIAPGEERIKVIVTKAGYEKVDKTRPYDYDSIHLPIKLSNKVQD